MKMISLSSRDANIMSCSMPISNKFHFEQFSPGFVIVYTNYCVDSFEHLHLGKGSFTHWPLFWGRDIKKVRTCLQFFLILYCEQRSEILDDNY